MEGGYVDPDSLLMFKVSAAARRREVGYFEYLRLMRQADEGFGEGAGYFGLAWDLAFAKYKPPKKGGLGRPKV